MVWEGVLVRLFRLGTFEDINQKLFNCSHYPIPFCLQRPQQPGLFTLPSSDSLVSEGLTRCDVVILAHQNCLSTPLTYKAMYSDALMPLKWLVLMPFFLMVSFNIR